MMILDGIKQAGKPTEQCKPDLLDALPRDSLKNLFDPANSGDAVCYNDHNSRRLTKPTE